MSVLVPQTTARTSHALTIRVGRRIIGAIHSFGPSQTRDVEDEFEVDVNGHGLPIDVVPQALTGRTLKLARYDLYTSIMEEVFGLEGRTAHVNGLLMDQVRPFKIREQWLKPGFNVAQMLSSGVPIPEIPGFAEAGVKLPNNGFIVRPTDFTLTPGLSLLNTLGTLATQTLTVYEYEGCYFTDMGRQLDARGERVVSVDANVRWRSRSRLA